MGIGRKLKGLLAAVAPVLGVTLGGPMGGVAMKFLADKFTGGDTGSVEDFLLSASPATLQELKLAELEFDKEMAALGVDLEEIAAKDRESARDLAKELGTNPQVVLSVVYTLGYFGVLLMFMTGNTTVPDNYATMFGGLLGVLSAAQVQIMNFWFGSSSGSKQKTAALARNGN